MKTLDSYIEESLLDNELENTSDKIVDQRKILKIFKDSLGPTSDKSVKCEFKDGKIFIRGGHCHLDLKKNKQLIPILRQYGVESEYTLFIENFKGKTSELGTQNWDVYSLTFNNCVLTIDNVVNVKGVRFNNTDIIKWTTTQDWERASVDGHSADYLAHAYIDDHCSKVKMATGGNSVIRKRGNIIKL